MDKDLENKNIELNAPASFEERPATVDTNADAVQNAAAPEAPQASVQNTSDTAVVSHDSSSTGIVSHDPEQKSEAQSVADSEKAPAASKADPIDAEVIPVVVTEGEEAQAPASEEGAEEEPAQEIFVDMDSILSDEAKQPYVEDAEEESIEEVTTRTLSPGRIVAKRFFRSKLSITGLVILVALFVFSFFGPLFKDVFPFVWGEQEADESNPVTYTYTDEVTIGANTQNGSAVYDPEGSNTVYIVTYSTPSNYLSPSKTHWFGTDDKGFDVFSRLMYGGRISLTIGFVVVILETFLGVLLGGISGYFGKWVDQVIMRIVDIFNCVPTMPMLMIVGVALEGLNLYGVERLYIMMAMMTLFGWAGTARLVRGQILSLREQDFMLSAEASGLTVGRKIFKHLIPNVIPQLIVSMTLGLGGIILTEATLGYLGIGLPTQYATWGNMINAASNNMILTNYPNLWITPGICIVLAVLGFNFVGDGLRDAFDPKARR